MRSSAARALAFFRSRHALRLPRLSARNVADVSPDERRRQSQVVARPGVLDLVDLRAEIRQHERREGPRQQPRQVEDADARERRRVTGS